MSTQWLFQQDFVIKNKTIASFLSLFL